jgi:TonB family protein
MFPKDYRKRYALIFLISLLVHLSVLVAMLYQPEKHGQDEKSKSVTVNLKPSEDLKKIASQKLEKEKAEAKKRADARKAEAKKEASKKAEAKKAEAKKAEAKKAEAKKAETKKAETKKAEAKKAEAKKAEAKKAEAKKRKQQAKQPGGAARSQKRDTTVPAKPTPRPKPEPKPPINPAEDKNSLAYWLEKSGSLTQLKNKELRATVIATKGESRKFANRDVAAKRLAEDASSQTRMKHNQFYAAQYKLIEKYYTPPPADGRKYDGYIRFLIDNEGFVTAINLKQPSGSKALDDAFLYAIQQVKRFPLPSDPEVRKLFIVAPKKLFFNETDMR